MIGQKYYEVHYSRLDEEDRPTGRSQRVIYELWFWQSPGRIFQELKLEMGYDNFAVHSLRRV